MKVLNCYAGIGGNRKLWEGCEVTAVENVDYIADAYEKLFPEDKLIREDAHQYLLDHFTEYDFVWSSPPCPTHSKMRLSHVQDGYQYPEMSLYQEIIILKSFFKGFWVVENVESYYEPLVNPSAVIDRHYFWANFHVDHMKLPKAIADVSRDTKEGLAERHGIVLPDGTPDQRKLLRNAVNPLVGKHIYDSIPRTMSLWEASKE